MPHSAADAKGPCHGFFARLEDARRRWTSHSTRFYARWSNGELTT